MVYAANNSFGSLIHEPALVLKVLAVLITTLLILAVFQSTSLLTLSYDLSPGELNDRVIASCEIWHEWMTLAGAAGLTQSITEQIALLHAWLVV